MGEYWGKCVKVAPPTEEPGSGLGEEPRHHAESNRASDTFQIRSLGNIGVILIASNKKGIIKHGK